MFVWIHGGGLTRGSSISDVRDGVPLREKGVVLVSMNYRLGALGLPRASGADGGVAAASRPATTACSIRLPRSQWVQKNIAAFGGDPSRVTIGGESAGSWSVNTLVASPLAKGLFIRAIGQSGGRFSRTPHLTEDRGSQIARRTSVLAFAKALGADSLAALRALPADKIVAPAVRTQENVDGWVLPDEIRTIFAEKKHNNVPVIVGSNADEMTSLGGAANAPKTLEEFRSALAQQYGELAAEFETAYGVQERCRHRAGASCRGRDTTFSSHMRNWARMTTAAGSKAYLYYFTLHTAASARDASCERFTPRRSRTSSTSCRRAIRVRPASPIPIAIAHSPTRCRTTGSTSSRPATRTATG